MPNHAKAIEQATLWDILDQGAVSRLAAALASDTPRRDHPEDALRYAAKEILREAAKSLKDAEELFAEYAKAWIGTGRPAIRRQKAGRLAERLGAKPSRLIAWLAYKYGLFPSSGNNVERLQR